MNVWFGRFGLVFMVWFLNKRFQFLDGTNMGLLKPTRSLSFFVPPSIYIYIYICRGYIITQFHPNLQVFVLSLQSYGLNCTSSSDLNQYLVAAGLFLSFAAVAPCLGYLSQWVPCLRRRDLSWSFYRTICTIGKIYQSLFVTMCSIGLSPFMCYLHPNGLHSMLKYPNMLCGSIEHGIMRMAGVAVLTLSASHFVLCCWACYQAPSWSRKRPDRLTSVGFLILNFRPSSWWYSLIILLRGRFRV